jgi:hypothetical protein
MLDFVNEYGTPPHPIPKGSLAIYVARIFPHILYGCQMWYLIFTKQLKLQMLEEELISNVREAK